MILWLISIQRRRWDSPDTRCPDLKQRRAINGLMTCAQYHHNHDHHYNQDHYQPPHHITMIPARGRGKRSDDLRPISSSAPSIQSGSLSASSYLAASYRDHPDDHIVMVLMIISWWSQIEGEINGLMTCAHRANRGKRAHLHFWHRAQFVISEQAGIS